MATHGRFRFLIPLKAAWQRARELLNPALEAYLLSGWALILLANTRAFSLRSAVPWDARDEMWFYFRWLGSALRVGHFGDFIPNIVAGYPIGANVQSGTYHPLTLLLAWAFPDSVLSINFYYLITQLLIFTLGFAAARTYRAARATCLLFGLSLVASGFVTGHASHFSYLASFLGFLTVFLGARFAGRGHAWLAAATCALGSFHLAALGYPAILSFGAQLFAVYFLVALWRAPSGGRRAWGAWLAGGIAGVAAAWPALWHFLNQLQQSSRAAGLSVAEVLGGSLPIESLRNFAVPALRVGKDYADSVDPTMDRFHLLFVSLPLIGWALYKARGATGRRVWGGFALGVLLTLMALGRHSFLPLRGFLAEHLFLYRVGRFPSGEHRGFALAVLAGVSAFGFETLWRAWPRRRRYLLGLLALDFIAVMIGTVHVRYMRLPADMQGHVARFKIEYRGEADRALLDAPRGCPFDPRPEFDQRLTPPHAFTWNGYTNLIAAAYWSERESVRWALCGPSRLWALRARVAIPYELRLYSPSRVEITVAARDLPDDGELLWADANDGFWRLQVNGRAREFEPGPATLRYLRVDAADAGTQGRVAVSMVYRGPLSRLWR